MITKMAKKRDDGGSSIHYLVSYVSKEIETQGDDKLKGLWYRNLMGDTTREVIVEMRDLMDEKETNGKFNLLRHFIISWPPGEVPNFEQVQDTGDHMLKALGAEFLQAVFALHQDTDNYHMHIVVNRMGFDGVPVDLANRWEVRCIQKAARELEIKQGWSVQHGGLWDVDKEGNIFETGLSATVKMRAKDFETFTGEKSEQRKLSEVCPKIFDKCKTWAEAHQTLNQLGVKLQRKGSGGILLVNDIEVKLSSVGRNYSWGNLIKKYGEFEEGEYLQKESAQDQASEVEAAPETSEELKDVKDLLKKGQPILVTGTWPIYNRERTEYIEQKKQYAEDRKKAREKMNATHKLDCEKLMNSIKNDHYQLNLTIMSGKDKNMVRKELALLHARQMAQLRRTIRLERHSWKKSWPRFSPGRFPSYKNWLKEHELYKDRASWVNRRKLGLLSPGEELVGDDKSPAEEMLWRSVPGILAFQVAKADKTGFTFYELMDKDSSETAFVDTGPVIKVFMEGEQSILAAMQLGISKWGSVTVNGDAEFQRKCFEVAIRHGIRVKNPKFELIKKALGIPAVQDAYSHKPSIQIFTQKKEATKSEEIIKETKPRMTGQEKVKARENLIRDFELYHQALAADRYRIGSGKTTPDGKMKMWILDKNKVTKESKGYSPDEVRIRFALIRHLAEKEEHLFFTPLSVDRHHILIDDLTLEKLEAMETDGYTPAYVHESSPGNYQAIINIPKLEDASPEVNNDILNIIIKRLNEDYGDVELTGGVHPHRIPSTPNVKEKHRKADGSYPLVRIHKAEFCICQKTLEETKVIFETIKAKSPKNETERVQAVMALHARMDTPPVEASPPGGRRDTGRAYLAHIADIKQECRLRGKAFNPFLADQMTLIRLRATGHERDAIKDALRQHGRDTWREAGKKRTSDNETYITNTVDEYAFAAQGDLEVYKWFRHIGLWMSIEFAEKEAALKLEMMTPVGTLPEIPTWILETDEQRLAAGFTEFELEQGRQIVEAEEEIISEMPDYVPEFVELSRAKQIWAERAKAEEKAKEEKAKKEEKPKPPQSNLKPEQ